MSGYVPLVDPDRGILLLPINENAVWELTLPPPMAVNVYRSIPADDKKREAKLLRNGDYLLQFKGAQPVNWLQHQWGWSCISGFPSDEVYARCIYLPNLVSLPRKPVVVYITHDNQLVITGRPIRLPERVRSPYHRSEKAREAVDCFETTVARD